MCCDSNIYIQRTFIINLFGSDIGLSSRPTTEANMTEYDIHEQLYEYTHSHWLPVKYKLAGSSHLLAAVFYARLLYVHTNNTVPSPCP